MMPRYSIAGIMLFTLGIAGGIAAAQAVEYLDLAILGVDTTGLNIFNRVIAASVCSLILWVASGLFYQAWDIRTKLRSEPSPQLSCRIALQFEICWRCCVGFLLPATYVLENIGKVAAKKDELSLMAVIFLPVQFQYLRWLLMLIAIGVGGGFRKLSTKRRVLPRWLHPVVWICGIILALVVMLDDSKLLMLMRVVLNSVEAGQPLKWQRAPIGTQLIAVERQFFWIAMFQLACAVLAIYLASRFVFESRISTRIAKRTFLMGAISLATIALVCEVWIEWVGFPLISPSFAESWSRIPPIVKILVLLVAVTYLSARASYQSDEAEPVGWRIHPQAYLHERRASLAIALLISASMLLREVLSITGVQGFGGFFDIRSDLFSIIRDILSLPENYWPLAMIVISIQRLLDIRRAPTYVTLGFSWRRFGANWMLFAFVGLAFWSAITTLTIAIWIPMGWS